MGARAIPFTATGDPYHNGDADETIAGPGYIQTQSGFTTDDEIIGFTFKGFTTVDVFDGTDASGTLVMHGAAPGIYAWDEPLRFEHGIWVVVTGTGQGSIWIAG